MSNILSTSKLFQNDVLARKPLSRAKQKLGFWGDHMMYIGYFGLPKF